MIDKVANEAARIMRENPSLKYYQAIMKAKAIIKGPQGLPSQKSQKEKTY